MINHLSPDFSLTPFKRIKKGYYNNVGKGAPVVTIITPFYNTGEVFLETYQCVCQQSIQNFEWIIVDDCSNDWESIELLKKIAENDSRVKVIYHKENKGPAGSRNTAVKNAKGEYLFFIDSDDLVEPTYLEKCLIFLAVNQEYSFVASYLVAFENQEYLWSKGFTEGERYLQENFGTSNFCARREMFEKVEYDESIDVQGGGEDWDFWLKCAENGFWGYCLPEFLQWYRIKKKRTWDFLDKANYEAMVDGLRKKYAKLANNFPSPAFSKYFLWEDDYNTEVSSNLDKFVTSGSNSENKNLLFVIPWMVYGGADKFNLDLIHGLTRKGWKITIVTTVKCDHNWIAEFTKITPDVFILNNYCHDSFQGEVISYLIKSRKIDLVFTSNSEVGYFLVPFLKNKFPSLPIVDYLHSIPLDWRNGGYPRISVSLTNSFDKHIVSSLQLKSWMEDKSIPSEKLEVSYINVDSTKVRANSRLKESLRKKHQINDTTCVIIFVARLSKEKQPAVLLQTAKVLNSLDFDFRLLIIGDGPEKGGMLEYVEANNLQKNVEFLGYLDNNEVIKYYNVADVFFLPSEYEGISLALYESMAMGCVPVISDVGGQKELVTSDCGFLVPRTNVSTESLQYVNIITDLIKDPARRELLSKNCRKRIETSFDLSFMHDNMERIFKQCIQKKKTPEHKSEKVGPLEKIYPMYFNSLLDVKVLFDELQYVRDKFHTQVRENEYLKGQLSLNNIQVSNEVQVINYDDREIIYAENDQYKQLASNISNWYLQEYEVLPLWYKRVGHIIKAFKGHRSFKSLIKK